MSLDPALQLEPKLISTGWNSIMMKLGWALLLHAPVNWSTKSDFFVLQGQFFYKIAFRRQFVTSYESKLFRFKALNSLLPIYTPGWREALWELSVDRHVSVTTETENSFRTIFSLFTKIKIRA